MEYTASHIHNALQKTDICSSLMKRFLSYTAVNTQSDPDKADKGIIPSTEEQREFAQVLASELRDLGICEVIVTENSYVCARVEASKGMENKPCIAFLAHMDTVHEVSGKDVKAQVIKNYKGDKIHLGNNLFLDPLQDKDLQDSYGDTIICTDGSTLLGSDDKAGIAEIMTAAELLTKSSVPHGPFEIIFSPDEETGHGMDKVPLEWMQSVYCFTLDGGQAGEIEAECFNAYKTEVFFTGKAKHTGNARPDMINAVTMASFFVQLLPRNESPETTDLYEGFFAPMEIEGSIDSAKLTIFVRDFSSKGIAQRLERLDQFAKTAEAHFPGSIVKTVHTSQYKNMKEVLDNNPHVMESLVNAVTKTGLTPIFKPIRGGTDGSRLTEMGKPTPNIFTGGHNFHSRQEWTSLSQMVYAVETILNLVQKS
ncbi:MAG TPA: peptidase T [Treponemataceae bacterium]|nr:peptidase T [Treponemataceae bacterium]